jgi:FKBP-type peptidyl-prolyl cis-trans isomerase
MPISVTAAVQIVTEGKGATADYNHRVFFKYTGKLQDSGEVVEGPREASTVLGTNLQCCFTSALTRICEGSGECVPALELGIKGMVVGEVAHIRCDPRYDPVYYSAGVRALILPGLCDRFAYGELARPAAVPSNAKMLFEVECLRSNSKKEPGQMSKEERIEWVTYKKETGNYFYSYGAFDKATKCYQEAIKSCDGDEAVGVAPPPTPGGSDATTAERSPMVQLSIDCGNNLATCLFKRKMYKEAKEVVVGVLMMDPNNFK